MIKSIAAIATVASIAAFAAAPANAGPFNVQQSLKSSAGQEQLVHKVKKGKFAAGLIIGLGTAAALGAGGYGYYNDNYSYRHERRCRRWRRRCWNGNHRACWKFDNRC